MIEVNGYVFIANFSEFKFLFGKSKNNQEGCHAERYSESWGQVLPFAWQSIG